MKKTLLFLQALSMGSTIFCLSTSQAAIDLNLPFYDQKTFTSTNGTSQRLNSDNQRDGSELEVTYRLTCQAPGRQNLDFEKSLFQFLSKDAYSNFKKLTKCKACEALSFTLPSEYAPWDKTSHDLRETTGYLPVAIEGARLVSVDRTSTPKLSYGADLMDDVYYDTDDFIALKNNSALRARKRWDSASHLVAPSMRRILVGLKATLPVDPKTGMKTSIKLDDRFENPQAEHIASFVQKIPTGFIDFKGSPAIIPSAERLYQQLSEKGALPSVGEHQSVLQLKPKTFLRSLRLRYHYMVLSEPRLRAHHEFGLEQMSAIGYQSLSMDHSKLKPEQRKKLLQIIDLKNSLQKPAEFAVKNGFRAEDAAMKFAPDAAEADLERSRQFALRYKAKTKELRKMIEHNLSIFAEGASQAREPQWLRRFLVDQNAIPNAISNQLMPRAAVAYKKALESLILRRTAKGVVDLINQQIPMNQNNPDFKDYQDFQRITTTDLENYRKALTIQSVDEASRQIEMAGTTLLQLWFLAYSGRHVSNSWMSYEMDFFIDTADIVGIFKAEPFEVDEYNAADPKAPPVRKTVNFDALSNAHLITENAIEKSLIGAYISNDVQLELGYEAAFLEEIKNREASNKDAAPVKWIMRQMQRFQQSASKFKMYQMQGFLKQNANELSCPKWEWKATDLPKGETSLKILSERK